MPEITMAIYMRTEAITALLSGLPIGITTTVEYVSLRDLCTERRIILKWTLKQISYIANSVCTVLIRFVVGNRKVKFYIYVTVITQIWANFYVPKLRSIKTVG
jgi:hypothetical protein